MDERRQIPPEKMKLGDIYLELRLIETKHPNLLLAYDRKYDKKTPKFEAQKRYKLLIQEFSTRGEMYQNPKRYP
jgi:hypothetical protein